MTHIAIISLAALGSTALALGHLRSNVNMHINAPHENPWKHEDTTPCMKNERGQDAWPCWIERNSRDMVRQFVSADATVLEVGARYGSVSCVIAAVQNQSGKVVSVEPDTTVQDVLEKNIKTHGCNVHVLRGVVGTTPMSIVEEGNGGYGTRTVPGAASLVGSRAKAYPLAEIEKTHNLHFDTFEIDCEGCLPTLLRENPQIPEQAKLMIIEVHNEDEARAMEEMRQKYHFDMAATVSRQHVLVKHTK